MAPGGFGFVAGCALTFASLAGASLLPAPASGAAPIALTLEQGIDLGLRQNRDLALLKLTLRVRESVEQEAADVFRLGVRPEARAELGDGDRSQGTYGFALSRQTTWGTWAETSARLGARDGDDENETRTGSLSVSLRQPLLRRFGPLVNREPLIQARQDTRTARRGVELRRADLVIQVVQEYGDLLRLDRQVRSDEATVKRLEAFARLAEARERQGRATRLDAMRAGLRSGDAALRLQASREQLQSSQVQFAELLGCEPGTTFTLEVPPVIDVPVSNVTAAVACALGHRLDYAQVLQDAEDARRGVRVARQNLLPDLDLIARYERLGEGASFDAAVDLDEDVWFVGLGMSSTFPRYREKQAMARADLGEQSAGVRVAAVRMAIERQVRQGILAYERAVSEIPAARRHHALAARQTTLAQRLYEMGRADSLDVADAEDDLRLAETRRLAAEASGLTAACRLLRVLGTLIEYPDDLGPMHGKGGQDDGRNGG